MIVLVALVLCLSVLVFAHAGWVKLRTRLYRSRRTRARNELKSSIDAEGSDDAKSFDHLPRTDQIDLIVELSMNFEGPERDRFNALAIRGGLGAWAESRTSSRRWWRRLQGARLITILGANSPVMEKLLWDKNELIRAQAAEWVPSHPTPDRIARLIELLDDENRLCRNVAHDSLVNVGGLASEALEEFLSSHRGNSVEGALRVATHMADVRMLAPALALSADGHTLVRARVAELLGALGGAEAVAALNTLTADTEASVRTAAATSLGRLGQWNSALNLVSLLGDPNWETRKAAGLALKSFGSPGLVALRHSARSEDAIASEMAARLLVESSTRDGR